jgi:hypothetical protein
LEPEKAFGESSMGCRSGRGSDWSCGLRRIEKGHRDRRPIDDHDGIDDADSTDLDESGSEPHIILGRLDNNNNGSVSIDEDDRSTQVHHKDNGGTDSARCDWFAERCRASYDRRAAIGHSSWWHSYYAKTL